MPVIHILSPHVADLIAAGEVVERPASVIKELVENALDAGARNITVEIRGGGATFIRVTDDGCGMSPEDAGIAFLRHATSKLKDEQGLECIRTMGFRGEALAAISAVSRVELRTRRAQEAEGCCVELEAGEIQEMGVCACPVGTVMTIRDLFYNTPARLKFLKSDRSESAACEQTALRCALGHPEVSLRFLKDGKECFFSPGDSQAESCIYSLLGRDLAATLIPCKGEEDSGMAVFGFVSSPASARGNRSSQYFYCNGRYIRSPLLQTAVEQAYKNTLLTGRYPACVLYLTLGHSNVDVNVHPAKTEVKFSYERKVFDLVYQAVRLALEAERPGVSVSHKPAVQDPFSEEKPGSSPPVHEKRESIAKPVPKPDYFQSMSAEQFREKVHSAEPVSRSVAPAQSKPEAFPRTAPDFGEFPRAAVQSVRSPQVPYQTELPLSPIPSFRQETNPVCDKIPPKCFGEAVENSVQSVEKALPSFRFIGEALKTYILVEQGDDLVLIDKHAAHERILFDKLKSQKREIMTQSLLSPISLSLGVPDTRTLEEHLPLLEELGFQIEQFGDQSYVVRAVPADLDVCDISPALEEICQKLRSGQQLDAAGARDEVLHTVACKAAIKAGWDSHKEELEILVRAVLSGDTRYCPHGRPVAVRMSRRDLDKQFKRIV